HERRDPINTLGDPVLDGLLEIECSLDAILGATQLLGHMCTSVSRGREVQEVELSSVQAMLRGAHSDLDSLWDLTLKAARATAGKHEEALTALQAALEAEKK